MAVKYDDILAALKWQNPIISSDCGKAEPPDNLKRDGMLVFADGVNWDPGAGRGFYVWNATSEQWEKIGTTEKVSAAIMLKAIYDQDEDGIVDNAKRLDGYTSDEFAPASHSHTESDLSFSDVTTGDVSTSKHGLCPKIAGNDGYVLTKSGDQATWAAPTGGGGGFVYDTDYQCLVVE